MLMLNLTMRDDGSMNVDWSSLDKPRLLAMLTEAARVVAAQGEPAEAPKSCWGHEREPAVIPTTTAIEPPPEHYPNDALPAEVREAAEAPKETD